MCLQLKSAAQELPRFVKDIWSKNYGNNLEMLA